MSYTNEELFDWYEKANSPEPKDHTTARKYREGYPHNVRLGDPLTSLAAGKSINLTQRENDCLEALESLGEGNAYDISQRIADIRGTLENPSNISSRLTSLVRKNRIEVFTETESPMGRMINCYRLKVVTRG